MGSYFQLACDLARSEAEKVSANKARQQDVLSQEDFTKLFIEKWKRQTTKPLEREEQTISEVNAEEAALFDRAAARAINSGAW